MYLLQNTERGVWSVECGVRSVFGGPTLRATEPRTYEQPINRATELPSHRATEQPSTA
jgi:hypothetical protein